MTYKLILNKIEIIFEIIKDMYDLDYVLSSDPFLEYYIINFISNTVFILNKERLLLCLIQEFDKLLFGKISEDVNNYKFIEKNRIKVSQFANKINDYIKYKKIIINKKKL